MKRKQLNRRKARVVISSSFLNKFFDERSKVEEVEISENRSIYIINGEIVAVRKGEHVVPFIMFAAKHRDKFPFVVVDEGAEEKIIEGADVLRPGIISYSEFNKGEPVLILGKRGRILAIGIALMSSVELQNIERGKVIKNVHYPKDKFMEALKSILST